MVVLVIASACGAPAIREEPCAVHVWVAGAWLLTDGGYVWVPGHWEVERRGAR
jgi:hypothetical protein